MILSLCLIASTVTVHGKSTSAYNSSQTEIMPLAKQYFEEGKLEEAKNLLCTLLSLEPYNATAHLFLGKTLLREKKLEWACRELAESERLAANDQLASQANAVLESIPPKFKQPQPRGCLAKITVDGGKDQASSDTQPSDKSADPALDEAPTLRQPGTLLLFGATWQNQFKSLQASVNKRAAAQGVKVDTYILGQPGSKDIFELFSVSQLPALVALNKHSEFVGALTGKFSDSQLEALVKAAGR
jgi:thioredoxin-like negative regulator of GroEL